MTAIFEQGSKHRQSESKVLIKTGPRRAGCGSPNNDKIGCYDKIDCLLLDNSGNTNSSQSASHKVQTKEWGNLGAQNCDFRLV